MISICHFALVLQMLDLLSLAWCKVGGDPYAFSSQPISEVSVSVVRLAERDDQWAWGVAVFVELADAMGTVNVAVLPGFLCRKVVQRCDDLIHVRGVVSWCGFIDQKKLEMF